MVNGYVTLDLASKNIYKESLGAIKSGKPVMVVDAPNVYFADTITTKTVDDDLVVVITKGGKTITITDANSVISEGVVSNPTMENIKDLNGNLRFVEFDGEVGDAVEGVEITFTKLSLSGTHLMAVVAGVINNATELDATHRIKIDFNNVPSWILDKMVGLSSSYPDIIDVKAITAFSDDFSSNQSVRFFVGKDTVNNKITLRQQQNLTTTAKRIFRAQFDLLIDAE